MEEIKQMLPSSTEVCQYFWWLRSANQRKFIEGSVMDTKKHLLLEIMFIDGMKTSL